MRVNPFNKLLIIVATVLAIGVGAAIAAGTNGGSQEPASTEPASTLIVVKGPCVEAEHANDPECACAQVPEDNDADENEADDQNDDNGRGRDHAEDDGVAD